MQEKDCKEQQVSRPLNPHASVFTPLSSLSLGELTSRIEEADQHALYIRGFINKLNPMLEEAQKYANEAQANYSLLCAQRYPATIEELAILAYNAQIYTFQALSMKYEFDQALEENISHNTYHTSLHIAYEAKVKAEAEAEAEVARKAAEVKAKSEADAAKKAAEAKAQAEAEAAKKAAKAKAKSEADAARKAAKAKAKSEADAARKAAEAKAKSEADAAKKAAAQKAAETKKSKKAAAKAAEALKKAQEDKDLEEAFQQAQKEKAALREAEEIAKRKDVEASDLKKALTVLYDAYSNIIVQNLQLPQNHELVDKIALCIRAQQILQQNQHIYDVVISNVLEGRTPIDTPIDDHGNTILHLAVLFGDKGHIESLLAKGVDFRKENVHKVSAARLAIIQIHPQLIAEIVPIIAKKIYEGSSLVTHIDRNEQGEVSLKPLCAQYLRAILADEVPINTKLDPDGNTMLHLAAIACHPAIVVELLNKPNIDAKARNIYGETPLELTLILSNREQVIVSLQCKAQYPEMVLQLSSGEPSPESCDISEELLIEGIKSTLFAQEMKTYFLYFAVRMGYENAVRQLLQQHDVDLNSRNSKQETAFDIARKYEQLDILKILQYHDFEKCSLEFKEYLTHTYRIVVDQNDPKSVQDAEKAMHAYALKVNVNFLKIVQYMVQNGCALNDIFEGGNTILHYAVKQSCINAIQMLLSNGADPKIKNLQGETAFDIALKYNHVRALGILKEHLPQVTEESDSPALDACVMDLAGEAYDPTGESLL